MRNLQLVCYDKKQKLFNKSKQKGKKWKIKKQNLNNKIKKDT